MSLDKNDFAQLDLRLNRQTKKIEESLDGHTKHIEERLAVHTKHIEERLAVHTNQIEKRLDGHTAKIEIRLDEQSEETKRHQQMLLEEYQGRLKPVIEVLSDHTTKLEALFEMVAMNTETLDIIKGMLKRKVDAEEFERLEKRVLVLENKLRASGV